MADYLAERQQVPRAAILLDEHGDNTEATAWNSAAIMKSRGLETALAVTQYFQITRSRCAPLAWKRSTLRTPATLRLAICIQRPGSRLRFRRTGLVSDDARAPSLAFLALAGHAMAAGLRGRIGRK